MHNKMYLAQFIIGCMITGVATNLLYRLKTRSNHIIQVKEKYACTRLSSSNGHASSSQQFTIIDKNDKIYTIPCSILSLQLDAKDKWVKMEIDKTYRIGYWGVCKPMLGLYPRIDDVTEIPPNSPKVL